MAPDVTHLQCSSELPFQAPEPPLTPSFLQVGSIDHLIEWGKVSEWFHPITLMTHAFFHTLVHIIMHMNNSLTRHHLVLEQKKPFR